MRAVIRTGEPKTLTFVTDHPEPTPSEWPESYIIRTHATALTRDELTWSESLIPKIPIPGFDLAGIVLATPKTLDHNANAFKPGDEVYSFTKSSWQGNAREISTAVEKEMALSARQALFILGKLRPEFTVQSSNSRVRVLAIAASGSVGIWGVQFAHLVGTEVVGTCGPSDADFAKSLGADIVLDYQKANLLECTLEDVWKIATKSGQVISVAEPPEAKKLSEANGKQLTQITGLIEQEKVNGVIDSVFGLEEYKASFEKLQGGHAKGKIVPKVN
ncbi:hypothetical protein CC78DRAFT_553988 [Lojkania enalia]|uniref:Enoyl reductase (ER) domain-containing protein n=1 Tax=Lojkania enalia TaxID=147567 RepID=A0A9P4KBN4_9PLEO|nr:hypothetical protein CC78DRAFT_553988 [Didymosphaeria enalia]